VFEREKLEFDNEFDWFKNRVDKIDDKVISSEVIEKKEANLNINSTKNTNTSNVKNVSNKGINFIK